MELQFNKAVIPYMKTISREYQTQEQTQEVRLTDGMPDIGRVLSSWGQILVRGKEWRQGGAGASGGVMIWVLYAPEDGTDPRVVETWLPFQMKWDYPDTDRDGFLCVHPMLRSVDARSLSARKLMVRAGIGMLGHAMVPADAEIYTLGELPDDVHVLKNTYPMQLPRESGEKSIAIEQSLSLPSTAPGIEKLIRYILRPMLTDTKVMADKLIMRGSAALDVLYRGTDGLIHTWSFELPFSQYADLDKEYDSNAMAKVELAVTALELEQGEEENLNLKSTLIAQYVIYDRSMIEIVEDVYSPRRKVVPMTIELRMPSVLEQRTDAIQVAQMIPAEGMRPVDAVFYPDIPQVRRAGDSVIGELSGAFQLLGYDAEGQLQNLGARWQGDWSMPTAQGADVQMTLQSTQTPQMSMSGVGIEVYGDANMDTMSIAEEALFMVTGMELGEWIEPDPDRPSLILRRAGTDRLWDIAKQTGSTVEQIKSANGLQYEPDGDQFLLIPVL